LAYLVKLNEEFQEFTNFGNQASKIVCHIAFGGTVVIRETYFTESEMT